MIRLLQAPWMISLVGCLVYLATTVALIQPGKLEGARSFVSGETKGESASGPSWNFRDPEFSKMVEELRTQKEELQQREQKLKELELRLQAERQEINAVTQTVARLQKDFDANVLRLKEEDTANLKKLAKLHAAMTPQASAGILKEIGDTEAAQILACMKVEEAAPILEMFSRLGPAEAKRAGLISERMRRTILSSSGAKPATR